MDCSPECFSRTVYTVNVSLNFQSTLKVSDSTLLSSFSGIPLSLFSYQCVSGLSVQILIEKRFDLLSFP